MNRARDCEDKEKLEKYDHVRRGGFDYFGNLELMDTYGERLRASKKLKGDLINLLVAQAEFTEWELRLVDWVSQKSFKDKNGVIHRIREGDITACTDKERAVAIITNYYDSAKMAAITKIRENARIQREKEEEDLLGKKLGIFDMDATVDLVTFRDYIKLKRKYEQTTTKK